MITTLLDPVLRGQPSMMLVAAIGVLLSWVVLLTSATLSLLRLDAATKTLQFQDPGPHTLADYVYAGVQVMTSFGTSDVGVLTTEGRRTITGLSVAAHVFNTIIVAILVSGMISLIL